MEEADTVAVEDASEAEDSVEVIEEVTEEVTVEVKALEVVVLEEVMEAMAEVLEEEDIVVDMVEDMVEDMAVANTEAENLTIELQYTRFVLGRFFVELYFFISENVPDVIFKNLVTKVMCFTFCDKKCTKQHFVALKL